MRKSSYGPFLERYAELNAVARSYIRVLVIATTVGLENDSLVRYLW